MFIFICIVVCAMVSKLHQQALRFGCVCVGKVGRDRPLLAHDVFFLLFFSPSDLSGCLDMCSTALQCLHLPRGLVKWACDVCFPGVFFRRFCWCVPSSPAEPTVIHCCAAHALFNYNAVPEPSSIEEQH